MYKGLKLEASDTTPVLGMKLAAESRSDVSRPARTPTPERYASWEA